MPQVSSPAVLQRPMVISAPGKVIFFGEHSVVYGKRAFAFSLGLRTHLTISPTKDVVELHLPEIGVEQCWPLPTLKRLWEKLKKTRPTANMEPQPLSVAEDDILRSFLEIHKKDGTTGELGLLTFLHLYFTILSEPTSFAIRMKSEMPIGAGLGSSAAFAVCLAGALMWLSGQLQDTKNQIPDVTALPSSTLSTICDWAFVCEKIMHGTPSGIDNAICTYGHGVSFKEGKITNLNPPVITVMLVNTRVPRNTRHLTAKVRDKYNRFSSVLNPLFESMDNLAETGLKTLNEMKANSISDQGLSHKYSHLEELIDMNQCLLKALGVSHPSLDEVVTIAKAHDLHAKLTGAGGGGFALVLLPPDVPREKVDACKKTLEGQGFQTWITGLGGQGISFTLPK